MNNLQTLTSVPGIAGVPCTGAPTAMGEVKLGRAVLRGDGGAITACERSLRRALPRINT